MSHNLEMRIIDGAETYSFVYAIRDGVSLPWHGLGERNEDGLMDVETALVKSRVGALFVSKFQHVHNGIPCGTFGMQRHDIPTIAGPSPMPGVTVGEDYAVIQYGDTCRNFSDAAFGPGSKVVDTMGALGVGERMFTTFLGETTEIRRGDPITSYNILSSSHDGTGAVLWFGSDTRVVCQNTLRIALANMKNVTSIRHTKNAEKNVNSATKALSDAVTLRAARVEAFKLMGNREMSVGEFKLFLDALYPLDPGETKGKTIAKRERITDLFEGAATGSRLAGNTAWGVFQAVTQDADESARGSQPWLTSLLNGTENDKRQKAFDYLLALCGA